MSDDEEVMHSDEEGSESEEEETPKRSISRAEKGPSEAQLAMQKRRQQQQSSSGLDDEAEELLEANRLEREKMEVEIRELRERSELRKREREQEERENAERRAEEEARRKADEEERKSKKTQEEEKKREARAKKMAEFEKWKNVSTPNFVISRKAPSGGGASGDGEEGGESEKKSKEQIEAEKKAILKQRIQPLDTSGYDAAKLSEKARELHNQLHRLESEKYDLERRFKAQLGDMLELAERARGMNKVGKQGNIKRIQMGEEETDVMQERFAGCPARIIMYSQFERQMDKRPYVSRKDLFKGPVYGFPAAKITPERRVIWDEGTGLPLYEELPGVEKKAEEVVAEEEE